MKFRDFMDELTELVMIIGGVLFLVPPFVISIVASEFHYLTKHQSSLLKAK